MHDLMGFYMIPPRLGYGPALGDLTLRLISGHGLSWQVTSDPLDALNEAQFQLAGAQPPKGGVNPSVLRRSGYIPIHLY